MTVIDRLPKRKDGTKVTPWDDDWDNDVSRGIYEPRWGRVVEVKKAKVTIPDPIKTGELMPKEVMMMFTKGAYKELFDRLYEKWE